MRDARPGLLHRGGRGGGGGHRAVAVNPILQRSLKDTFCNQLKHGFFHQNKRKPQFTRQCPGA